MRPATSSPRSPQGVDQGRGLRRGAPALLPGSSPRFTSTRIRAPGDRRAIASPSASRSTECHHVTHGTSPFTLLRCSRPTKCQVGGVAWSASTGALASSSWARFSPRSVRPASSASTSRVDRHRLRRARPAGSSSGSRPARRAAPRSALAHVAERVGDRNRVHGTLDHHDAVASGRAVAPVRVVLGRLDRAAPPGVGDVVDARRRASATCSARGRSNATCPPSVVARDAGTEAVDQRTRARPRRTRSGAAQMHGPITARTGPVPSLRTAADARLDHPTERAAPSGVHRRHRGVVARSRSARSRRRSRRAGGPATVVALPSPSTGSGGAAVDLEHVGAVHVERPHPADRVGQPERARRGVRRFASDRVRIVADVAGEVQRVVRRCRDPAVPVGEDRRGRNRARARSRRSGIGQRRNSGTSKSSSPSLGPGSTSSPDVGRRARAPRRAARAASRVRGARPRSGRSRRRSP